MKEPVIDIKMPTDREIEGVCMDCGKDCMAVDHYIVDNQIWNRYVGGMEGYLHRECLERRMGRRIKKRELLVWSIPTKRLLRIRVADFPFVRTLADIFDTFKKSDFPVP